MILLFIYLLAMVCWIGGIIFFSFFTMPSVFGALARPDAGKVASVIFPRYYILGYVAGGIAFFLAIYLLINWNGPRLWWLASVLTLGIALGCTLYAGLVIRPRVDAIRTVSEQENPDPATKAEFDNLHKLSVQLNGAVLLLDLIALFGTAAALAPRV
ncbi:MAG TPA: DUF4149 domain-containing protein [Candidatus Binataceae bacterium]|nr:DUF4149 domain-containing protein [Candidatus Binataceae bacterium]